MCLEVDQHSNILQLALEVYKDYGLPQTKLFSDIVDYAIHHYAFCSPNYIILAQVIENRGWYIYLAVSNVGLRCFFEVAPFELPFIGFSRPRKKREEVKWHEWQKIYRLCFRTRR